MGYADESAKPNIRLKHTDVTLQDLLGKITKVSRDTPVPMQIGIYGSKGTGKTIAGMKAMLSTLKEDQLLLYIDSAENWSSIRNHPEIDETKIIRYPYSNVEGLFAWVEQLRSNPTHKTLSRIGAIILDEYSSMVQADLTWITKARADTLLEGGDDSKDPYTPLWPEYRSIEVRFLQVIQGFMNIRAGMSLCLIAHEKFYDKEEIIRAAMPSATAADFEKLLHGVYRAFIKETRTKGEKGYSVKREILFQTAPTANVSAKTRFRVPLYATLEQLIKGYQSWGRPDLQEASNEVNATNEESK